MERAQENKCRSPAAEMKKILSDLCCERYGTSLCWVKYMGDGSEKNGRSITDSYCILLKGRNAICEIQRGRPTSKLHGADKFCIPEPSVSQNSAEALHEREDYRKSVDGLHSARLQGFQNTAVFRKLPGRTTDILPQKTEKLSE